MPSWVEQFEKTLREVKTLEKAVAADEEKPFDEKYAARKLYPALLEAINACPEPETRKGLLFYHHLRLGTNYFDTEENSFALENYKKAVEFFESIEDEKTKRRFEPYFVKVLNNIGFYEVNNERLEKGLEYLTRSNELATRLLQQHTDPARQKNILFFDRTAFNRKLEKNLTLNLFFLAQTYAKAGERERAAELCGKVLERQLEEATAEGAVIAPLDLTNNVLGLAQFYREQTMFAQAVYLLDVGMQLLNKSKSEEVASLKQMQGNVFKSFFSLNLDVIVDKVKLEADAEEKMNKLVLNLKTPSPIQPTHFAFQKDYDQLKPTFAKALQLYNEARQIFEEDHTSDFCELVREISSLWALTLRVEKDPARIEAINVRRQTLIEPLLRRLNAQYYARQITELSAALAEIYASLFEETCKAYRSTGKSRLMSKANSQAREALSLWDNVLRHYEKTPPDDSQNVESFVNCLMSKGRLYSMMIENDKARLVSNLLEGKKCYELIAKTIREFKEKRKVLNSVIEKQLQITEEYIKLLPVKIANIQGQVN